MEGLMQGLITALPAILAIVTPVIVEAVKKISLTVVDVIPKPLVPVIAAIVGVIGEVLVTGTVTQNGPIAGAAGVAVRNFVHTARSK